MNAKCAVSTCKNIAPRGRIFCLTCHPRLPRNKMTNKILFSVTSRGESKETLFKKIEKKSYISSYAKEIIGKEFVATKGIRYDFVGIRGTEFDHLPTTKEIFGEAKKRGYFIPTIESGMLLREKYTQNKLGENFIAVFHEPVRHSDGRPNVLGLDRRDDAVGLYAWIAYVERQWVREFLFLFLAPQVSQPLVLESSDLALKPLSPSGKKARERYGKNKKVLNHIEENTDENRKS